jgi:septum formation protein
MMQASIYLASRSPRRRELLHQVGIRFDVLLFRDGARSDVAVDETWLPGETPETYVQRVACAKARFGLELLARRKLPLRPVLAADTTLDMDGEVIGKPTSEADAVAILSRLSGRSHAVLTAIAVAGAGRIESRLSKSEVRFRALSADEIKHYVASGEPMDKAGAYGLQGRAAVFIEEIHGSNTGIVGLPLCETALLLRDFGYPS